MQVIFVSANSVQVLSLFRFIDLSLVYDLLPQFISQIFAGTMVFIFRKHGDLVRSFEHSWSTERGRYRLILSLNPCSKLYQTKILGEGGIGPTFFSRKFFHLI